MYVVTDGDSAQLYGVIWEGDGQYIVSELKRFLKDKTEATIRVHSPGGSVHDGNLIYNAIKASKTKIHMVIDGVAASMMTIIMTAADTVSIAENGWVMIHAPSGSNKGNAKSFTQMAKVLTTLEAQFVKKYMERTGNDEATVKEWLNGDNWFSAQEALDNKIVDAVVDSVMDDTDVQAYSEMSLVAMIDAFKDYEEQHKPNAKPAREAKSNSNNSKEVDMKLNAQSLLALGLSEGATEADINAAIERQRSENESLKAQAQAEKEAKIKELIDPAVESGKILATEKEQWTAIANTNFEAAKTALEKLPVKGSVAGGLKPSNPTATGREDWDFKKWRKEDPAGLIAMKTDEPENYKKLAEAAGHKIH